MNAVVLLCIVSFTMLLIVSNKVKGEVAATLSLLAVAIATKAGLLDAPAVESFIFAGFSSNAIVALGASMILAGVLVECGAISTIAAFIVRSTETDQRFTLALTCLIATLASALLPNAAVAAIFVPICSRLSTLVRLPIKKLLMPVAICIILGGTLTMSGSTALILANDIYVASNSPEADPIAFLAPTPIGIAIIAFGIPLLFLQQLRRKQEITVATGPLDTTATYKQYLYLSYASDTSLLAMQIRSGLVRKNFSLTELDRANGINANVVAIIQNGDILESGHSSELEHIAAK